MASLIKHWLAKGRFKSLVIVVVGFGVQVVSWFWLFGIVASNVGNQTVQQFSSIASIVWCNLPLLSIIGLLAGIAYQRRHGLSWVAIVGIVLNGIWFLMAAFAFFMVFVMGVTA